MKKISISFFLLSLFLIPASIGSAHNPFTEKPEKQHMAPKPLIKSKFFIKIIFWQQQLREKMSKLIREAKTEKSMTPFFILIVSAFAYGVIHSVGPGHGKAVALSYILSCKPSFSQGLIFGNLVAFTHGFSGIFFVLTVKYLLQTSISASLETMTSITQIISYSLITCLGLIIFFTSIYKWIKNKTSQTPYKLVCQSIYNSNRSWYHSLSRCGYGDVVCHISGFNLAGDFTGHNHFFWYGFNHYFDCHGRHVRQSRCSLSGFQSQQDLNPT